MPLKEYRCKAHGEFEAYDALCPHGCSPKFVKQEFRTAFAIKSAGTKVQDRTTRDLASDFGLSDVRTDKEGGSVMDALRKADKLGDFAPRWGKPAKEIGTIMASAGVSGGAPMPKLPPLTPNIVGRHVE